MPGGSGQEGKAIVRAIRGGTASYSQSVVRSDSPRQKLSVGHRLRAGDTVISDGAATVDLHLGANGRLLRLLPGTVLCLEELRFSSTEEPVTILTRLRLEQGRTLAAVGKLETGSVYEVATPKGTYRARGPAFDLAGDGRLVVLEGAVERVGGGAPIVVKTGEAFDQQSGTVQPASPEIIAELRQALGGGASDSSSKGQEGQRPAP
jgi:hypothetical protein